MRLIKKHKPKNISELKSIGFKTKWLGEGSFRSVFGIENAPLVVKFPHWGSRSNKRHCSTEVQRIARLGRQRWLRRYLPKVYYHDKKSGVLVMQRCYDNTSTHYREDALRQLAAAALRRATTSKFMDFTAENIRIHDGVVKIIDLGY